MFNNIGKKIKAFAKVMCILGIVGSVLGGVGMAVAGGRIMYGGGAYATIIGVGIAVVGSLMSWISNFLLYGFGELVDKTTAIEERLNSFLDTPAYSQTQTANTYAQPTVSAYAQNQYAQSQYGQNQYAQNQQVQNQMFTGETTVLNRNGQ